MDERSRYVEKVQELYLSLRGGGLTLSPLDSDRIRAWRDQGLPLELALQGVRAAHEAWRSGGQRARPFQLRNAERWVADLAQVRARRTPGVMPEAPAPAPAAAPPPGAALPRILSALEARRLPARGAARAAYEAAIAILASHAVAGLDRALLAADEAQALRYVIALPPAERSRLVSRVVEDAGPRGHVPRRSYRAMLRALLGDEARRHGNLVRPSDVP